MKMSMDFFMGNEDLYIFFLSKATSTLERGSKEVRVNRMNASFVHYGK